MRHLYPTIAASFLLAGLIISCGQPPKAPDKLGKVSMIPLKSASGESLPTDFFNEQSVTVVEFFFTSCQGACPIMKNQLKSVYDQVNPDLPVKFLSVTVDPKRDTPEQLIKYQHNENLDPSRWTLARGNVDTLRKWIEGQFHLGVGNLPAEHPTRLVLVDNHGEIRGYFDGLDKESVDPMINTIHLLLKEEHANAS